MSTRSSIWLGESEGKSVHIYWELAERETENGRMEAPIYSLWKPAMLAKKLQSDCRKRLACDS